MSVPLEEAEPARARLLELFPDGFEEVEGVGRVELAAYTDAAGERALREEFARVEADDVEPGWEDRWKAFHRPVRIGPLWVGPPWVEPASDAIAIVIDPGRAFGTGAHPTTRLTLELLLDVDRGALLDVGSGSGVLAIAAAKLGFAPVTGVDVDAAAVEVARANAAANDVSIALRHLDALRDELPPADVALANIARDAVERLAPRLDCRVLVTSGYFDSEERELPPFRHVRRVGVDGWAADLHER